MMQMTNQTNSLVENTERERTRRSWDRDARADRAEATWARLQRDAQCGELCGRRLVGPFKACLFELLGRLGWEPSYDSLASAMPHMPETFGIDMMREVLARVGFPSYVIQRRADEVAPSQLPALVMGVEPMLLVADANDGLELVDPETRQVWPCTRRGKLDLVCFGAVPEAADVRRSSWLGHVLGRLRGTMWGLVALTFVINSVILLTSLAIMAIYDLVLPTSAVDTLVAIALGAALVIGFDLALRRARARFIGHLSGRIEYLLGSALLSKILSLPVERLNSVPVSTQVAQLRQFEGIRDNVAGQFALVAMELPFALLFTVVLIILVGPIGFIPLALTLLVAAVGLALFSTARQRSVEAQRARTGYNELFLDTLSNLQTVRNLGCEDLWAARLDAAAVEAARTRRRSVEVGQLLSALSAVAAPLAGGATVALGALEVLQGNLSTGALVTCMIVVWRIISPMQQGLMLMRRLPILLRLVRQVDALMAMPSEDDGRPSLPTRRVRPIGRIAMSQATYRYAGSSEPAIAALDLDVRPGEFLAVSGPSGAGKTTLLHLMQGLVTPLAGVVSLDGRNLRQMPLPEIRAAIGLVPQRPQFFHGTILQNLRLAAPMSTDTDIQELLDELGVLDLVRGLPNGLETRLTETQHGELSRGVRQTLALGRTLLRNPSVLLLDEPAQSLDAHLDSALIDAIRARHGRMTIVMVSHRPSHIKLADRHLILQHGRLAQINSNQAPAPQAAS